MKRKLRLDRESIRHLTGLQLSDVAAGTQIIMTRPIGSCTTDWKECPDPSLWDCAR